VSRMMTNLKINKIVRVLKDIFMTFSFVHCIRGLDEEIRIKGRVRMMRKNCVSVECPIFS
jgi:hypothetical protein